MLQVHFQNIKGEILSLIGLANHSIQIAIAYISDSDLFSALINKCIEGVNVELLISNEEINFKNELNYNDFLRKNGKMYCPKVSGSLMHNKFCIIDSRIVVTGSFNWTFKASMNFENILVVEDQIIVKEFEREFLRIKNLYKPLKIFSSNVEISSFSDRAKNYLESEDYYNTQIGSVNEKVKLYKNEVLVVGGDYRIGKLEVISNLIFNMTFSQRIPSLLIALNNSKKEYIASLLSLQTGISTKNIQDRNITEDENCLIENEIFSIVESPLMIYDGVTITIEKLEKICESSIREYGIRVVFLDRFEFINIMNKEPVFFKQQDLNNSFIIKELNRISHQLNIAFILATNLNIENSKNNRPNQAHLKPGILENINSLLLVYNPSVYGITEDEEGNSIMGIIEIEYFKKGKKKFETKMRLKGERIEDLKEDYFESTIQTFESSMNESIEDMDSEMLTKGFDNNERDSAPPF